MIVGAIVIVVVVGALYLDFKKDKERYDEINRKMEDHWNEIEERRRRSKD